MINVKENIKASDIKKEIKILELKSFHKNNQCLNCGKDLTNPNKFELCEKCQNSPENHFLIEILNQNMGKSYLERMLPSSDLKKGNKSFKKQKKKKIPLIKPKEDEELCHLCNENPISDKNFNLCKKCVMKYTNSSKLKDKLYGKRYRKKLIREKRCTTCKKDRNRGIGYFFINLYEILNYYISKNENLYIKNSENKKKNQKEAKKTCIFCRYLENQKRRDPSNCSSCKKVLTKEERLSGKKQCKTCRNRNKERYQRYGHCRRCHTALSLKLINKGIVYHKKCEFLNQLSSRKTYFIKKKIIKRYNLNWSYKEIPASIKREVSNILTLYFILEEPFRKYNINRFDFEIFFTNYVEKYLSDDYIKPEVTNAQVSGNINRCVKCKRALKTLQRSRCQKCKTKDLISGRKKRIYASLKKKFNLDLPLSKTPYNFRRLLGEMLWLYYIFEESYHRFNGKNFKFTVFYETYKKPFPFL